MSKFLNETGLKHFWDKAKEYFENLLNAFADNVVIKNEDITIIDDENNSSAVLTGKSISLVPENGPGFLVTKEENKDVKMTLGNVEIGTRGLFIDNQEGAQASFYYEGFGVASKDGNVINMSANAGIILNEDQENELRISADGGVETSKEVSLTRKGLLMGTGHGNGFIGAVVDTESMSSKLTIGEDKCVTMSSIDGIVHANAFAMNNSDNNHVLLGGGSTIKLNAAGGIPKLNAQGKLDASMVDIDNTLFEVVAALPTTGIKENRIYLVPSEKKESNNTYIEYIYTGDVNAAYDAAKWEKLGEYTADIDLTPYAKKTETVKSIDQIAYNDTRLELEYSLPDDPDPMILPIDAATTTKAGVMSAADKRFIDIFSARYPLKISSLTATPSLLEVGAQADINFAWGYENNDLHTPELVQIKTLGGDNVAVNKNATSYKESGVTGATTAATKTATLTVKYGDKTVTRSVNLTYHYPSYIGVVANGAAIDEATVKALTKSVEWGKGKTAALTQANQKIVYAYPASYGDLTSIKDGNGFQGFAGYTKQTLTIGGQAYNVYVQNLPATSSSTYTFA